jgi:hypothetical protein
LDVLEDTRMPVMIRKNFPPQPDESFFPTTHHTAHDSRNRKEPSNKPRKDSSDNSKLVTEKERQRTRASES